MGAALFISLSLDVEEIGPPTSSMSVLQLHLVLGAPAGLIACILERRGNRRIGPGRSVSFCLLCFSLQLNQLLWGSSPSGFMQWRPVAFSEEQRSRESALPCQASPLRTTSAYSLPHSPIVQAFFGSQNNFCVFNLTFGAPTGPGYWDQRYLCW